MQFETVSAAHDYLIGQSKVYVLDLFKQINGGSVGFDHERTKKTECVTKLLTDFSLSQVTAAMRSLPAPAQAVAPQQTVASAPVAPAQNPAAALDALRAVLGVQVDEAKVREIVLAEVSAALENSPVVRHVVVRPDESEW